MVAVITRPLLPTADSSPSHTAASGGSSPPSRLSKSRSRLQALSNAHRLSRLSRLDLVLPSSTGPSPLLTPHVTVFAFCLTP